MTIASVYQVIQATIPQPASSSSKSAKSKKKSVLHGLKKKDLISLLKEPLQDDENDLDNESKTSLKSSVANDDNPYYHYDGSLFGHEPIVSLDLFEVWFLVSTSWSQVCYYQHIPTKLLKSLLLSLDMTLVIYDIHTAFSGSTLVKWIVNDRSTESNVNIVDKYSVMSSDSSNDYNNFVGMCR